MNNGSTSVFKIIINILIVIFLIFVVGHLFIFLLPIILVLIAIFYLYRIIKIAKFKMNNASKKEAKKDDDKTIEAEIIEEKFDK